MAYVISQESDNIWMPYFYVFGGENKRYVSVLETLVIFSVVERFQQLLIFSVHKCFGYARFGFVFPPLGRNGN